MLTFFICGLKKSTLVVLWGINFPAVHNDLPAAHARDPVVFLTQLAVLDSGWGVRNRYALRMCERHWHSDRMGFMRRNSRFNSSSLSRHCPRFHKLFNFIVYIRSHTYLSVMNRVHPLNA